MQDTTQKTKDTKETQQIDQSVFINGSWQKPVTVNGFIDVVNPATGKTIALVATAGKEDVDVAVASAKQAFDSWQYSEASVRANYLTAIANTMQANYDKLCQLSVVNNGKPLLESQIDMDDAIACYRYYAQLISTLPSEQTVELDTADFNAVTQYQPMGVVALITPWNFPLVTSAWKIAPALASGCTLVMKPSEVVPLPELEMGNIMQAIGLPKGVFNLVVGGAEVGAALTAHADIDKISFTGSNAVGKKVMQTAAQNYKNISLELGGKSAIVVFNDVDIEQAVEWIIGGIFYNAGQMCSATSRLLVQDSIANDLLAQLKIASEQLLVSGSSNAQMGAMTTQAQYQKVLDYIAVGKQTGLNLLTGGEAILTDTGGYFIAPTIFVDVPNDSLLWREEIFGPVLCVQRFSTEDEAIAKANDSDYGLAATVVSRDIAQAKRVASQLKAGHIWLNSLQVVLPQTSWGGYKHSGIGRELGIWGLRAYQEVKQVIVPNDFEQNI